MAHLFGVAGDRLVRFQEFYDFAAIVAAFTPRVRRFQKPIGAERLQRRP